MAWSRAQGIAAGNATLSTAVASIAATFPNPLTSPSVIVVSVYYGSGTAPHVTGVSDTAGNTYTSVTSAADATNGQALEIWWASNTSTTASNNVTAAFSPNEGFAAIIIDEFTGGGSSPSLDKQLSTASSASSPGPYTMGTITPTVAGELIYSSWINDTNAASANAITGNGSFAIATANNSATTGDFATEWFSQGAAAAVAGSFSWTASGTVGFVICEASFKASTVAAQFFQGMPVFFQG